jgi:multidrug efflux pump subunit AcrA (membrane-fusion protein)
LIGIVKGENQIQVFPDVPGKLISYEVKEGEYVKKGDVIALIDRSIPGMEYEPSKVKSPISGIVLRLPIDIGMTVAPQVPIAYIGNKNRIIVSVNVGEKFFNLIKPGKKAIIITENGERKGIITRISPFLDPQTRSAYCEISIEEPKDIIIGSVVEVYVIVNEKKDAKILPIDALMEDLKTGEKYIFVVKDSIAEKKVINTGIITDNEFEILDTIPEMTPVITIGKEYLKDKSKILIVE